MSSVELDSEAGLLVTVTTTVCCLNLNSKFMDWDVETINYHFPTDCKLQHSHSSFNKFDLEIFPQHKHNNVLIRKFRSHPMYINISKKILQRKLKVSLYLVPKMSKRGSTKSKQVNLNELDILRRSILFISNL